MDGGKGSEISESATRALALALGLPLVLALAPAHGVITASA